MLHQDDKKFIEENLDKLSLEEIARKLDMSVKHLKREIREHDMRSKVKERAATSAYRVVSVSSANRIAVILIALFIFILVFLVYSNSLKNDFIWDDEYLILNNSQIKSFSHLGNVFKTYIGFGSENVNSFYRPMQELSNMTDYFLWAQDPFGFHLTNVILHSLVAVLAFLFLFYLCGDIIISAFAAILFGVHPVHTEAVAYIAGRADPLYAVFFLASFIFLMRYINHIVKGRTKSYLLISAIAIFIFSILSKEVSLVYPLLVILFIGVMVRGSVRDEVYKKVRYIWAPAVAVVLIYGYLRFNVLNFFAKVPEPIFAKIPVALRLMTFSKTIPEYIGLLIAPVGLHMERGMGLARSLFDLPVFLSVFLISAAIVSAVFLYRKGRRLPVFFIGWFFINLLPVSNIFPINSFIAEHWIYMSSIGCFFAVAYLFRYLFGKCKDNIYFKIPLVILASLPVAVYSLMTIEQNKAWRNEIAFFESTLKYTPNNARLYLNFGNTYYEKGQYEKAMEKYRKAIELDNKFSEAYGNMGGICITQGDTTGAEKYLNKAIELNFTYPVAHYALGVVYYNTGRTNDAIRELELAVKQMPQHFKALNLLGKIYLQEGVMDKGQKCIRQSLKIMPGQKDIESFLQ